jgi:hypothetical protein
MLLRRMSDDTNRFSLHPEVLANVWRVFGTWYSTSGAERPNSPIRKGDFQTYEEWWNDWFADEEEDDEETED